jgi:hypothetical protein
VGEHLTSRVVVTREARGWRAELVEQRMLRRARTLYALDRRVRELVGPGWVDYQFRTGDATLDRLVAGVRAARRAIQAAEDRARELTEEVLTLASGLSQRDLGILLDLSHQRVHQILQRTGRAD